MKSTNGQILPLALVLIFVLALLWVMLLNVGKLVKDRIQMQIASDTAVQSACAYRARGLNIAGLLNSWLGVPILGIGIPQASWWMAPPHAIDAGIAKQSIDEVLDTFHEAEKYMTADQKMNGEKIMKGLLRGLLSLIQFSYDTHPKEDPNYAQKQRDFIESVIDVQERYVKSYGGGKAREKAREIARAQGVDDIYIPRGQFSLGLARNKGLIWYLGTLHVWLLEEPEFPILATPYLPINEDDDPTKRWYEQGPGRSFQRQSVRLYSFRRPKSPSNGAFPLGQSVFNMKMPYLYAVASARVYNPDGPMFPTRQQGEGFMGGLSAKTAYDDASNGWHAQLSPIGGIYDH
jgi:hypothetical protein